MIDLEGVIDLHVHAGPDVRPRRMTALELTEAADSAGMHALLLKNHHASTALAAAALSERGPIRVFGGLALNDSVGGINPFAVEAALKMGAKEIWLPTLSAENQCVQDGRPGTGLSVLDSAGKVKSTVLEVLRMVAVGDVILGTGHLSAQEIVAVVRAARTNGVRRILVTHPEIKAIQLPVSSQREIAAPGVYFERCFARPLFGFNWDQLASAIREVGVESTVLATDLGQPENPDPVSGMRQMLEEFSNRGFSRGELRRMSCHNPAVLLGLE